VGIVDTWDSGGHGIGNAYPGGMLHGEIEVVESVGTSSHCPSRWGSYACVLPRGHAGDHADEGRYTTWCHGADDRVIDAQGEYAKERVYTMRASKIETVRGALGKLAARAEKLAAKALRLGAALEGYEPIAMTVLGEPFVVKEIGEGGAEVRYLAVRVTLSGRAPKLGGWQLLATLQHEEAGVIVRALPGTPEGLLTAYRNASSSCTHCRVDRARKDTYIVQHQDGTIKQVGRTCLADFTRTKRAEEVARLAALLREAADTIETGGSGQGPAVYPLQDFLAMVACFIGECGWRSRTAAREQGRTATADLTLAEMVKRAPRTPTPVHHDRARAALEGIHQKLEAATAFTDYEHNLSVALATGYVTHRSAGLIASILPAYDRELGRIVERQANPAIPGHFGQIGKRSAWTLHLVKVASFVGNYGAVFLHTFRDDAGHVAVWKTTSECKPGRYSVAATVKAHDTYQGQDQTVLTRAKLVATESNGQQ